MPPSVVWRGRVPIVGSSLRHDRSLHTVMGMLFGQSGLGCMAASDMLDPSSCGGDMRLMTHLLGCYRVPVESIWGPSMETWVHRAGGPTAPWLLVSDGGLGGKQGHSGFLLS